MATDDVQQALEENATGPKRVVADGVVVEQHPLDEVVEAHKHLAAEEASKNNKALGMRLRRVVSPGATS